MSEKTTSGEVVEKELVVFKEKIKGLKNKDKTMFAVGNTENLDENCKNFFEKFLKDLNDTVNEIKENELQRTDEEKALFSEIVNEFFRKIDLQNAAVKKYTWEKSSNEKRMENKQHDQLEFLNWLRNKMTIVHSSIQSYVVGGISANDLLNELDEVYNQIS